jgi:hypothetical protein
MLAPRILDDVPHEKNDRPALRSEPGLLLYDDPGMIL